MTAARKPQRARRAALTLRDLAKHAQVSPATVSLVLRKSPLVAEATRKRVLEAMRALGYVYNRGAASLRTRRTHTVGVAINELVNPYFAELTAAIERALWHIGRTVFLSNSAEDPARQAQFIETMREYNADGLIICPTERTDPASLRRLRELGVACVLISRNSPGSGLDYAGNDHRRGMFLATEHLISLGHRRIAMIGGTELSSTGIERIAGYREALAAYGIAAEPAFLVPGPPSRSHGAEAIKALLARRSPPTATVCFNDVIAFGVMLGLRQLGAEPGRDFAVVGCDDLAEAALWTPALTTIRIQSSAMGEAAAGLLLDRIADLSAPRREVVLQPELIVRESSALVRPRRRHGG
ncbi:MAG TPA: LacI family DNA-binding transcriptional regulator [Alphaproteobacteria bacterium]|nr:LacI family DNA-binding transcriptional regulator [Alphaproteobacteria bacterium]